MADFDVTNMVDEKDVRKYSRVRFWGGKEVVKLITISLGLHAYSVTGRIEYP